MPMLGMYHEVHQIYYKIMQSFPIFLPNFPLHSPFTQQLIPHHPPTQANYYFTYTRYHLARERAKATTTIIIATIDAKLGLKVCEFNFMNHHPDHRYTCHWNPISIFCLGLPARFPFRLDCC